MSRARPRPRAPTGRGFPQGRLLGRLVKVRARVGLCEIEFGRVQATSSICRRSIWRNERIALDWLGTEDHAGDPWLSGGGRHNRGLTRQSPLVFQASRCELSRASAPASARAAPRVAQAPEVGKEAVL